MKIQMYQVDAFTDTLFKGNPAAVCPLGDTWLNDSLMQNIAMENNLSETAFLISRDDEYHIRWFTPTVEVDLCGHATLATGHVLFRHLGFTGDSIHFISKSGVISIRKDGEYLTLDFPTDTLHEEKISDALLSGFNIRPETIYKGRTDFLFVYKYEEQIRNLSADYGKVVQLPARAVAVTARGTKVDFVSRFFAPQSGVNEDPVTGSVHTMLVPYWRSILKKDEFTALQLSKRTGSLRCRYKGERTEISGQARTYFLGEIDCD